MRQTEKTSPHKWRCNECKHEGWLKSPGICQACDSVGKVEPLEVKEIKVVHRSEDSKVTARDDVTGNELDPKLTLRARQEEMDQFKNHGMYERVPEEI